MEYVFPPRPKDAVPPGDLPQYESTHNWVVQRKFKGTRTVVRVTSSGEVLFFNRHKGEHKQWQPTRRIIAQILDLDLLPGVEYWLDGELLHNKVSKATDPHLKNRIVLFDVLMMAGTYLFGVPDQMGRLAILDKICHYPTENESHHGIALQVSENLWMAETFADNFTQHFRELLHLPEIEGVVLRRRDSVLDSLGTKEYECSWLVRCRKSEGHYQF